MGCGDTMVVHMSLTTILAPCNYLIRVTFVTCEKSVVQFDSTKHRRFCPDTPVSSWTLDS